MKAKKRQGVEVLTDSDVNSLCPKYRRTSKPDSVPARGNALVLGSASSFIAGWEGGTLVSGGGGMLGSGSRSAVQPSSGPAAASPDSSDSLLEPDSVPARVLARPLPEITDLVPESDWVSLIQKIAKGTRLKLSGEERLSVWNHDFDCDCEGDVYICLHYPPKDDRVKANSHLLDCNSEPMDATTMILDEAIAAVSDGKSGKLAQQVAGILDCLPIRVPRRCEGEPFNFSSHFWQFASEDEKASYDRIQVNLIVNCIQRHKKNTKINFLVLTGERDHWYRWLREASQNLDEYELFVNGCSIDEEEIVDLVHPSCFLRDGARKLRMQAMRMDIMFRSIFGEESTCGFSSKSDPAALFSSLCFRDNHDTKEAARIRECRERLSHRINPSYGDDWRNLMVERVRKRKSDGRKNMWDEWLQVFDEDSDIAFACLPNSALNPRKFWSISMEQHFAQVVNSLGGLEKATARAIWEGMTADGANPDLSPEQVKNHLNRRRSKEGCAVKCTHWSIAMEQHFAQVVNSLGGLEKATGPAIWKGMTADGANPDLSPQQVRGHLCRRRSKEGVAGRHILWTIPMKDLFDEVVNKLGGLEKATGPAIWKGMIADGANPDLSRKQVTVFLSKRRSKEGRKKTVKIE